MMIGHHALLPSRSKILSHLVSLFLLCALLACHENRDQLEVEVEITVEAQEAFSTGSQGALYLVKRTDTFIEYAHVSDLCGAADESLSFYFRESGCLEEQVLDVYIIPKTEFALQPQGIQESFSDALETSAESGSESEQTWKRCRVSSFGEGYWVDDNYLSDSRTLDAIRYLEDNASYHRQHTVFPGLEWDIGEGGVCKHASQKESVRLTLP